jgi:tetratricopeptide (TPR) repeat protein
MPGSLTKLAPQEIRFRIERCQGVILGELADRFFAAPSLGGVARQSKNPSFAKRQKGMKPLTIRVHGKFAAVALLALLASLPLGSQPTHQQASPSAPNQKPNQNSNEKPSQREDQVAPLLAQAQDALDRKNYAAAVPLLEKVVAAEPTAALPHFDLGVAYSQLKRNPEAIGEFRRAISLDPNFPPAQLNLGLLLLDSDPAAAAASFQRAAQLLPGQVRPVFLAGEALERGGRRAEAIVQYRAAVALAPKDDAILVALAGALLADGQSPAAESTYRDALALKPDSAPAQFGLAESLLREQKTADAADVLKNYLQNTPDDRQARFERAVALHDLSRLDESIAELDRLDASAAPTADGLKLRGSIYMQQKKWTDAAAAFTKALAASPDDAQLHLWIGHTKMELRDYPAAETELRRSLQLTPANPEALGELASVYYLSGQYEAVISALDLLAQRETLTAINWFFRALSCDKLGRKPEAAAAYQKFLDLDRGERPDQEFQAQARLKLLLRELSRSSGK